MASTPSRFRRCTGVSSLRRGILSSRSRAHALNIAGTVKTASTMSDVGRKANIRVIPLVDNREISSRLFDAFYRLLFAGRGENSDNPDLPQATYRRPGAI